MCALPIHPCQSHAMRSFLVLSSRYAWLLSPLLFSLAADHCSTQRRVAPKITPPPIDVLAPIREPRAAYQFVRATCLRMLPPLHRVESGTGAVVAGCSFHSSKKMEVQQDNRRQVQT